jgi:cobalt-zinc-cadmium efflux system protein
MLAEVAAGVVAGSLALLSDAAHMLTDAAALGLALVAARLATRPPSGPMTFGLGRAEILSAQVNGATLIALALLIVIEAVRRLLDPSDVEGGLVLLVAIAGALVNLVAARVLASPEKRSLNVEGAYRHVLTDMYAFAATAVAGAVVLLTGFRQADPIASLLVAGIMLVSGWNLLKASGRVILEGAPEDIDPEAIGRAMAARPDVIEIHDLHVWEVTSGFPSLSAHVVVAPGADCHGTRRELSRMLRDDFGLDHTTLQVEHATPSPLIGIENASPASR